MALTVNVPVLLARHAGGQRQHVVAGATVREAIGRVIRDYPEFGQRFVEATLPGNEISIVSAIAGG